MRFAGSSRARVALTISASTALLLGATSGAQALSDAQLVPRTHFVMAPDGSSGNTQHGAWIPNIDSVKSTIRTYYGATGGIAAKDDSPYIREMKGIEDGLLADLPAVDPAANKAIVFDADDTTLWTYDMEDGAMKFNFDPVLQNTWVQDGKFPAVPGMVAFEQAVQAKGYHVFGITGRNDGQEVATLDNLAAVGYTGFDADNFFTKFKTTPKPDYLDCHSSVDPTDDPASCSTVEYKAGTRKHIEADLGMDIVLNLGDQWSDLQGGYADRTVKLPNPTYYLPSPNVTGAPTSDADLTPRTAFTMAADGSSGNDADGEGIPNIDSVKSTIRTYYGATNGIAAKDTSPYISEMNAVAATWAKRLGYACARQSRLGHHPAVVFDADDTTLWTYDMEDGAMKFNFDPTLQNTWVQEERFQPTPGMRRVVRSVASHGCKVIGLTGRNNTQRVATLDNLAKYYYDAATDRPLFRSHFYFTKWTSGDTPPAYVDPSIDGNPATYSTVDYKASTRKYVQEKLGLKIIGNFGDQLSDLRGGYSTRTIKLPNPTYYLP